MSKRKQRHLNESLFHKDHEKHIRRARQLARMEQQKQRVVSHLLDSLADHFILEQVSPVVDDDTGELVALLVTIGVEGDDKVTYAIAQAKSIGQDVVDDLIANVCALFGDQI